MSDIHKPSPIATLDIVDSTFSKSVSSSPDRDSSSLNNSKSKKKSRSDEDDELLTRASDVEMLSIMSDRWDNTETTAINTAPLALEDPTIMKQKLEEDMAKVKIVSGFECKAPFDEISAPLVKTLENLIHDGMNSAGMETQSIASHALSEVSQEFASLWAVLSAMSCVNNMLVTGNVRVWSVVFSLRSSGIFLSEDHPSLEHLAEGDGVYITSAPLNSDEHNEALRYLAPEVAAIDEDSLASLPLSEREKVAVFAFGLLLLECATGDAPHSSYEAAVAHQRIRAGKIPSTTPVSYHSLGGIIKEMISPKPASRPSLEVASQRLRQFLEENAPEKEEYSTNDGRVVNEPSILREVSS